MTNELSIRIMTNDLNSTIIIVPMVTFEKFLSLEKL